MPSVEPTTIMIVFLAVGYTIGSLLTFRSESKAENEYRLKLLRDLQDLRDDKKAADKRHARLMQHLTALTNDLYRRHIGRRCVIEELQAVKAVYAGTVDAYMTGCRTPRQEEQ